MLISSIEKNISGQGRLQLNEGCFLIVLAGLVVSVYGYAEDDLLRIYANRVSVHNTMSALARIIGGILTVTGRSDQELR